MVRNTSLFPIDPRAFYERGSLPLHIDEWDITRYEPLRLGGRTIDLARIGEEPCVDGAGDSDDCRLVSLIDALGPWNQTAAGPAAPERETMSMLYVDLPGANEKSWKAEYAGATRRAEYAPAARIFAHPFIAQSGDDGWDLALQYWFFYPVNDGANNHEGDWEHINVVVRPRSRVTRSATDAELQRVLDGPIDDPADPIVIARVEYYFHHFISTLDYSTPNAYASRADWLAEVDALEEAGRRGRKVWRRIRARAWEDEGESRLNTRPIVWIGGDGIGIQTLLEWPGLRDRDGHSSYPFRGYYKRIAPGDVGERVLADFDHREWFAGRRDSHDHVEDYGTADKVALLPDWERLVDLVRREPGARRDWAWFVLPMRFGFPASPSPVAGLVRHSDMGNVSVVGPAYNDGWNRVGQSRGYEPYDLVEASWARPLGFTDSFFPRLGFLNAPIVFLLSRPPLDLIWRTAALPFRAALGSRQPTFLPASMPATRLVSLEVGPLVTAIPDEYLSLFFSREQLPSLALALALATPPGLEDTTATPKFGAIVSPVYGLSFHISPRFSAESAVTWMDGEVGFDIDSPQLTAPIRTRADLSQFEFQGTLRYNLATGPVQPYVKLGSGITWYRLRDARVNDVPLLVPDSPRYQPSGAWYALGFNETVLGGGLDWHRLRLGRTWLGLKVSYTAIHHDIGFERNAAVELLPELAKALAGTTYGVWRHQVRVVGSLGF